MDELEKYISNNASQLDVEPNEGHFQRFEQRLDAYHRAKRQSWLQRSMRVAAVAVLMLMSTLYVGQRFFTPDDGYTNIELQEAEYYYKTQISNGINTIEAIDGVMSEEQRALLLKEMEDADELLHDLQEELKLAPDDPRLIEAMLQHYRLKASVINKIVNGLQHIKTTQNNYNYETNM